MSDIIIASFAGNSITTEDNNASREHYDKSRYGEPASNKRFVYALVEALNLIEREKMIIKKSKNKNMSVEEYIKKSSKMEKNFTTRYAVYSDLRKRGYIIKTALKFGADFRVYPRGVKPGDDHAKWVVFPVSETESFTWFEFSAKNRVAHSTKKKLLLGVVDAEEDVTYYEIAWKRP